MATFNIVDWTRKQVETIDLADEVFATTVKKYLHWDVVRWQQAKSQAGTHSAKTRSNVRGTGRKPFKQKGTGRARQGHFRSPLQRGGAIVHGPLPRSHAIKMPAKVRRGALRSVLSMLAKDERLFIVKDFGDLGAKSRLVLDQIVGKMGVNRAVLVDTRNESLKRGAHNLPKHKYLAAEGLNVRDLLHFGALVVSEAAVKEIEARLKDRS